jgi:DedD protein
MATRSEAPDLAVDELQRRARRRLVGAIVLALAAAVILPLLLESDPKPLGDEVSIRIPPIDNGKFVNPLSPGKGPEGAAAGSIEPKSAGAAAPKKTNGQPKTEPVPPSDAQTPREADAKAAAPSAPETQSAAKADAPAASAETAATGGGFVVQLGAFADAKVAADLAATLKGSGFAAYTEMLTTGQGAVQRVRVGPYTSRDAADAAAAKLKSAGYGGALVTSAK